MTRLEFPLEKNLMLIIEETFIQIVREDALLESSKITTTYYSDISKIKYHPRKINWFFSSINFLVMTFLEIFANPVSGKIRRIEISLKNGANKYIDLEPVDEKTCVHIFNELSKRINAIPA